MNQKLQDAWNNLKDNFPHCLCGNLATVHCFTEHEEEEMICKHCYNKLADANLLEDWDDAFTIMEKEVEES